MSGKAAAKEEATRQWRRDDTAVFAESTVAYQPPPAARHPPAAAPAVPRRRPRSRRQPTQGGILAWAIASGARPALVVAVVVIGGAVVFGGTPGAVRWRPVQENGTGRRSGGGRGSGSQDDAPRLPDHSGGRLADSSDPRFASDPNLLRTTLREETRRDLMEKAVASTCSPGPVAQNYGSCGKLLLGRQEFIEAMGEDTPQAGKGRSSYR